MTLCYHGTSADNLQSILENGLLVDSDKIWAVSFDAVYCWTKHYVETEYGSEDIDDKDYVKDILIRQAFDSASCALAKSKDCRAIIVIFDVDENELEEDDSCENMSAANCVYRNIKPQEIVKILVSNDLSIIKGLYINWMINMPLYNKAFTELEEKVAEVFDDFEYEIEDELEWTEVEQLCAT